MRDAPSRSVSSRRGTTSRSRCGGGDSSAGRRALSSRHQPTSHADAWGSRDNPIRWTSTRTRCTCCRRDRADAACWDHTCIRARSSNSRTTRSASHHPGAREAGLGHTCIHARSSCFRSAYILSPRPLLSFAFIAKYVIFPRRSLRNAASRRIGVKGRVSPLSRRRCRQPHPPRCAIWR